MSEVDVKSGISRLSASSSMHPQHTASCLSVWCCCAGSPFQPYRYEGQMLIPGQANNVLMCAAGTSCRHRK